MDLTIIYGDDQATENRLRTRQGGKMKTNWANVLPEDPNCQSPPCYFLGLTNEIVWARNRFGKLKLLLIGDVRLVQTPMLALQHSLFLRLHNTIAPLISTNDEIAYQEAKRITTALYQRIVYNEWLPVILGRFGLNEKNWKVDELFSYATGQAESTNAQLTCNPTTANCGKYNKDVDPSNTNDFTHGAFRWLHAFVPSTINMYSNLNPKTLVMSRALSDMNSSQVNILDRNYDNLLRGQLADAVNYGGYSPELRNKLMKDARGMGIDLFSIDIKRARDHGVRAYVDYIPMCLNTQTQINTWADLDTYFTPASLNILKLIYKSPRDIDLLVGVLGERRLTAYTILGKIGSCILAEQFRRFKFGDRFFYQFIDGVYPFIPGKGIFSISIEWSRFNIISFVFSQHNYKRSNVSPWLNCFVQWQAFHLYHKTLF